MLVTAELERQTQVDFWGSVPSQPSLVSDPQVGETLSKKTRRRVNEEQYPRESSALQEHGHNNC